MSDENKKLNGAAANPDAPKSGFAKWWEPILRPIVSLVAICVVTSLLLALTNNLTAGRIADNVRRDAELARQALLPEADGFAEMDITADVADVTALYEATNGTGYVIEASGQGYGGRVPVMVAIRTDGTIAGVAFLENNETPGLGKKLNTDPAFGAQFMGLPAEQRQIGDIDAIANATVSSRGALTAINSAVALYNEQIRGVADEVAGATGAEGEDATAGATEEEDGTAGATSGSGETDANAGATSGSGEGADADAGATSGSGTEAGADMGEESTSSGTDDASSSAAGEGDA